MKVDQSAEGDRFAPRLRTSLLGHEAAERRLLQSYASGKMHHAWLLAGPRGIGKATLAFRLARFVLAHPDVQGAAVATSLYVSPDAPAARRVASGGHADLLVLERQWDEKAKRYKAEISAAAARQATEFFAKTAGEGGWRVCIVDAADDLNAESANAILKTLEEPPAKALFILVSHRQGSLLPTIRSRCIRLELSALEERQTLQVLEAVLERAPDEAMERAARLAHGSPGRAVELLDSEGAAAFAAMLQELTRHNRLDVDHRIWLADRFAGRATGDDFAIFCELLQDWTASEARRRAFAGGGAALARAFAETGHSIREANALNLDRRQTVLDALDALDTALKAA